MKNNQFNTALREITLEQLETVAHNPKNSEVGGHSTYSDL